LVNSRDPCSKSLEQQGFSHPAKASGETLERPAGGCSDGALARIKRRNAIIAPKARIYIDFRFLKPAQPIFSGRGRKPAGNGGRVQ
jgi:hypothetical protein